MSAITKMPPNRELAIRMQELRRSSASSKHANKARYNRTRAKRLLSKEF